MMKEQVQQITNYVIFLIVLLLLTALQSSLWLQLFGWFPAPQVWLTILVFWILYRELWEGILMVYLLTFTMSGFTSLPLPQLLALNILVATALFLAKKRVYWSGSTFFMLACGAAVLLNLFFTYVLSWRYDKNPIRDFEFFAWIMSLLLTMLFSLPLHRLYSWFDQLTDKEHPTEAGTGVL